MKLTKLFLFIFVFAFSVQARAYKYKKDSFHLSVAYTQYDDVRLGEGADVEVASSIDLEAGLRLQRIFKGFLFASLAPDSQRTEYGLGLRVELPGFFFINGRMQDFIRKGMKRPINTSLYLTTAKAQFKNPQGVLQLDTFAVRYGLSMSWFPMRKQGLYFRLEGGVYSVGGNGFLTYGLGMGLAF